MRSILLLLSLLLCMNVQAKKKTDSPPKNNMATTLTTPVNTVVPRHMVSDFNVLEGNNLSTLYFLPVDASFQSDNPFGNFGEGFGFVENSYKMTGLGNSGFMAHDVDAASTDVISALEPHAVFRQGLFYGFTLMLVLLNLVCFFLFEEKTYLYYSLSLFSLAILLFFSDGLATLIGFEFTEIMPTVQTLLLLVAVAMTSVFASKYLSLQQFLPKLKFITIPLLIGAAALLSVGWAMDNPALVQSSTAIQYTVLGAYFMAGIFVFSKKNYAKFYVVAAFIPLLFSIDFFVLHPMGIEFLSTQTIHIKAAMIAEMLIITYAIMYRMQAIKEENVLRQAELRIFLKRQEVLSARQKTEKLVEDVYLENLIMHYDLDGLEIKLLQFISEGKENAKIARKLKTTEHEIEEMTKDLYEKLEIGEQIQQDYRMVESQPDYIYN